MKKLPKDLKAFEDRLGHSFANPDLLIEALTHPSVASETRVEYQRMEFLGDRILGLVIAKALLDADKEAAEGKLAPRFNALVRKETCADVAKELGVGKVLRLGKSEMVSGGRKKEALLADAAEAVIAAVYLDGGFATAQALVLNAWGDRITNVDHDARDAKTALQEWAQAKGLPPPSYTETSREGPDHMPVFTIQAELASGETASAQARSKRQAEQAAAQGLLDEISSAV